MANWTRPDLLFLCSQLSRFSDNPGPVHMEALKRGLRYLKGTRSFGITYPAGLEKGKSLTETTEIYVDADYASNQDNRRSVSGIYLLVNDRAVYWYSKQKKVVAMSTAEAEYIALA